MSRACPGWSVPRHHGITRWMRASRVWWVGCLLTLCCAAPGCLDAGEVVTWGDNYYGESTPPVGLTDVVAIAAGMGYTVALKADGTVAAWGYNGYGQCTVPAGLSGVVAIAAGHCGNLDPIQEHTVALTNDGHVVAWGYNGSGQSTVPDGLSGVTAIAAGGNHTVALTGDGTVVLWGYNGSGQCAAPVGLTGVIAVAAGTNHTVALKNDGTVVAWGDNSQGQCTTPVGLTGVIAIAAGRAHTVALKNDGTVVAWGGNFSGQCDVPPGLTDVIAIAAGAGYEHTVALRRDGTVVAWGSNAHGECTTPPGLTSATAIAAGGMHTVALSPSALIGPMSIASTHDVPLAITLMCNDRIALVPQDVHVLNGVCTSVTMQPSTTGSPCRYLLSVTPVVPGVLTVTIPANTVTGMTTGLSNSSPFFVTCTPSLEASATARYTPPNTPTVCPLGHTGNQTTIAYTITSWPTHGSLGAITSGQVLYSPNPGFTGDDTFSYTASNGVLTSAPATVTIHVQQVVAWGDDSQGQCTIPVGLTGVTAIAAEGRHTVALKEDGTVVAWGDNDYGVTTVPDGLSGVVAIAAGLYHTVALKLDGTVVAWGNNDYGQCTPPGGLTGVTAIAAGGSQTLALTDTGAVVCWGSNTYGEGTTAPGLSGVTAIACGYFHNVAVNGDGTVVAWGENFWGQCTTPTGLSGATAVAGGWGHSVALTHDGTVVAWGDNSHGNQCVIPTGLSNVTKIGSCWNHTVALKSDGSVVVWGDTSVVPDGMPGVSAVAAGIAHTVALLSSAPRPTIFPNQTTTSQGAIPLTISFNLVVDGFSAGSIQVVNGSITGWSSADSQTFTTSLIPDGLGTITITIPAGAATAHGSGTACTGASATLIAGLTANSVTGTCLQDTTSTIALSVTSTPPVLSYGIATPPSHGQAVIVGSQLTYTPDAHWFGTETFTYTADNGAYSSVPATVTVSVTQVNMAPVITTIPDQSLFENGALTVPISGISAGSIYEAQTLTITAVSSDHAVLADPSIIYTSPQATGNLLLTPAANAFGTAQITLTLHDNGGTAHYGHDTTVATFQVSVVHVNQPPTLDAILDQTWPEDSSPSPLNLTGIAPGPSNESAQTTTLTAFSSNPSVLQVSISGSTLTCTPAQFVYGSATVFVRVKDDGGTNNGGIDSFTRSFDVTTTFVNHPPIIAVNTLSPVVFGQSLAITAAMLAASDPDQPAHATLSFTLSGAPQHGALALNGVTVTQGQTFTQDDIDQGRLIYQNTSTGPGSDVWSLTLADGLGGTAGPTNIPVDVVSGTSHPPSLTWSAPLLAVQVGTAGVACSTAANASDVAGNLANGALTVDFLDGADAGDRITLDPQLVTVANDGSLSIAGTGVGSVTGGSGSSPLAISLVSDPSAATVARVNTVIQALRLASVNPLVPSTARTLRLRLSDGSTPGYATATRPVLFVHTWLGVPGLARTLPVISQPTAPYAYTVTLVQAPSQGSITVGTEGTCTYSPVLGAAADDAFDLSIADGSGGVTAVTQPIHIALPGASGLRFTTTAPVVCRANEPVLYNPAVMGGSTLVFTLLGLDGVAGVHFTSSTGSLNWDAGRTIPVNGHYRFGVLVEDPATQAAAYQPILLQVLPGGGG